MLWHISRPIPGGVAHALADDHGAVLACGFGPVEELAQRVEDTQLRPAGQQHPVAIALDAYARGHVGALAQLRVSQPGTEFRQQVWGELRGIEPGKPVSYQELARRVGRPSAVRAVASACANNRVALILPCHRVVRSDGSLGGYYFGLEKKRALLDHEATAQHSG